ncbi:MAG TPA: response regulator [Verrucomicrobiae bacterium]|nr:response regulator [Verrucomicrobiae bacterium]
MPAPVRILHLEDDRRDAEMVRSILQADQLDCEIQLARSRGEFERALQQSDFDLILSDYSIPNYTGFSALEFARSAAPGVPFILLSGTLGEELAVESLRGGATDYLLKDRIHRLVPAIQRAVCEAREKAEKKKIETQFLRNQRMESIGALAGGIAHDLNNILAPIIMAAQLLRHKITDENDLKLIDTLEASAQRGAGMVKQVLTFARGAEGERSAIQVRHLLTELRAMIVHTFPRSIQIKQNFPNDLWTILGDATQLYQVFMNLAVNARDAMPNGGQLEFLVQNTVVDHRLTTLHPDVKPGPYLLISVRDTGTGMSPEVLKRIYEPFFTTKAPGKGTGLGLSTVVAIVKNHDGVVHIDSTVGHGTRFDVYLPKLAASQTALTPARSPELPVGKGQLILVADDELALRELMRITLEQFGYRVCTACDGNDALEVFIQHQSAIAAVVTDLMMPFIDGAAALASMKKRKPEIKFILCTGLAEQQEKLGPLAADPNGTMLLKPCKTSDLLIALHRVLHGSAPPLKEPSSANENLKAA